MLTPGTAHQSMLTKIIWDWYTTDQQTFSSGNEEIRNVVLAASCERLLPNNVELCFSTSSRTKVVKNGRYCLYS